METFKKCIHGRHLKHSGIIGYVQDEDFNHWHKRINCWIDELIFAQTETYSNGSIAVIWSDDDKLAEDRNNDISVRYLSKNKRTDKGIAVKDITLYHLWVKLF